MLSDPMIYIFLQPVVRETAATKIQTFFRFVSRAEANQSNENENRSQGEQTNNNTIEWE